ncbi:MAG TPA: hypothetical protein VM537_04610 [Anaerolineae bacterium]|nr:hypothetical protein [Anaerolineae bacterium]
MHIYLGGFLLAAATFVFEISLTRIFSLNQFYHFAFMAVSLALLGFGASGSVLVLWPRLAGEAWCRHLTWLALAFGPCLPASYLLTNLIPFDSYTIAWDPSQVVYLLITYLVLTMPFVLSGLVQAIPLSSVPQRANRFYGANLAGSAAGCLLAVLLLPSLGGPGTIAAAGLLGWLAAAAFAWRSHSWLVTKGGQRWLRRTGYVAGAAFLGWLALAQLPLLDARISPYKGLSQALRYPGSRVVFREWNGFSRVDLVDSPGVRQLPGLSYMFEGMPPPQLGMTVDGDDLSPVPLISDPEADLSFSDYLPAAIAYRLRPQAVTLILEPKGGLEVWSALAGGAAEVTAVESNPLLVRAARFGTAPPAGDVYDDPRVTVVTEPARSYLRHSDAKVDILHLPLTQPYRPVTSGAYSLAEDYLHTVEAFSEYLAHLDDDGILIVTRWLQTPPSESVRTLALIDEALRRMGREPLSSIVAFRGVQTGTFLVQIGGFSAGEMEGVRKFCSERSFDLVAGPGIGPADLNRHNVLAEPVYAQIFSELLAAQDPELFYRSYEFAVSPPTDDRPFFFHFFRWQQTPAVLRSMGKTWQPFGGSGIFVLLALLGLALIASLVLIAGPLLARRRGRQHDRSVQGKSSERAPDDSPALAVRDDGGRPGRQAVPVSGRTRPAAKAGCRSFAYFALLGLGYMFVEIPLIQRFILFLGQPVYAMTCVLFTLLLFSGLGSLAAARLPHRLALAGLVGAVVVYPLLLPSLFQATLGLELGWRFGVAVLAVAPVGFLMGVPFPKGLELLRRQSPGLIPWVWAVNGCTSVLGSILAAMGAMSQGFNLVQVAGSGCYAVALVSIWTVVRRSSGAGEDLP